ncbi:MAG: ferredoxin [Patescibacteria group bacterium]|nr:ferredoxin [Patescibacteria group bacterium]
MKYKVKVDKNCCLGCGSCVAICPENFELDEEGKSQVKNEEIEDLGCSQQAADACPANCIKIEKIE